MQDLETKLIRLDSRLTRAEDELLSLRKDFDQRLSHAHLLGKIAGELMSVSGIAKGLGISRQRVYQYIEKGGTPEPQVKGPPALYALSDWVVWYERRRGGG